MDKAGSRVSALGREQTRKPAREADYRERCVRAVDASDLFVEWRLGEGRLQLFPHPEVLLGSSDANLSAEEFVSLVHSEDRQELIRALASAFSDEIPVHADVRIRPRGGSHRR